MTLTFWATTDKIVNVIELLDTLFGFARRFRPRSESAPGPLEPANFRSRVCASWESARYPTAQVG